MHDTDVLLRLIKKAAMEAVKEGGPCSVLYGTVKSTSPLIISVDGDEKRNLTKEFLYLTRSVKDHEIYMTVDHETEEKSGGVGAASFESHKHAYKGKKKFLVHNNLKLGERVLLLMVQGGDKFIVWDRMEDENASST